MKFTFLILIASIALFFPEVSFAQYQLEVPLGQVGEVQDVTDYIAQLYTFLVGAVGIVATVMVMWGGVKWILAAGSGEKINDAKRTVIEAIIGVVLALSSYLILSVLNASLVTLQLPSIDEIAIEAPVTTDCLYTSGTCQTDTDCVTSCGEGAVCTTHIGSEKYCTFPRATGLANNVLCTSNGNCASGTCVKSTNLGGNIGACSGGELRNYCFEDDQCGTAPSGDPMVCILNRTGWLGNHVVGQCTTSSNRGFNESCKDDPSACGPGLVCREFSYENVAYAKCLYEDEADCDANVTNEQDNALCHLSVDCRRDQGGECSAAQYCCDNDAVGYAGCTADLAGKCLNKVGAGESCFPDNVCLSGDCDLGFSGYTCDGS